MPVLSKEVEVGRSDVSIRVKITRAAQVEDGSDTGTKGYDKIEVGVVYTDLTSPNGAFGSLEVIDVSVSYADDASPDTRNYRVDFSKITRALPEFEPRWTVKAGVRELHEAYKSHGLTEEEFLSSRYLRIKRIQEHLDAGRIGETLRWR